MTTENEEKAKNDFADIWLDFLDKCEKRQNTEYLPLTGHTITNTTTETEIKDSSLPWLCQDCDKIPASCGKSIGECEHALWRQNEYERGNPR